MSDNAFRRSQYVFEDRSIRSYLSNRSLFQQHLFPDESPAAVRLPHEVTYPQIPTHHWPTHHWPTDQLPTNPLPSRE